MNILDKSGGRDLRIMGRKDCRTILPAARSKGEKGQKGSPNTECFQMMHAITISSSRENGSDMTKK